MADFTRNEIETGRKLFAGDWQLHLGRRVDGDAAADEGASRSPSPAAPMPASRSLINALTGRKALARTSNTPGRTQELIFFQGPDDLRHRPTCRATAMRQAPKAKVKAWTDLIHSYLAGPRQSRPRLCADRWAPRHQGGRQAGPGADAQGRRQSSDRIDQDAISCRPRISLLASRRLLRRSPRMPRPFRKFWLPRRGRALAFPELRAAIVRLIAERRG